MSLFSRKKKEEELKQEINDQAETNKAYRLSKEMRELAETLLIKAEQLEKELDLE